MMGKYTKKVREVLNGIDDIADVISPGMAVTPPNGHPFELFPPNFTAHWISEFEEGQKARGEEEPYVTSIEKAIKHVNQQVAEGADFIKIMIDDGSLHENLNVPVLSADIMKAAVEEAHKLNKITLAHAMTAKESQLAVDIGIDGLAHVFIDRPDWTPELVKSIADRKVFVTPCLVLNSSFIGIPGAEFANDSRVNSKLSPKWLNTINSCYNVYKKGKLKDSFKNVIDLYNAGVDILVGTDVAVPIPGLGGLAHGASVHHELQLLVEAGFKPIEALRAATSVPARIFKLSDRGNIKAGVRADLLLVDGDPTINISDTLSIREVWLRGKKQNLLTK
ncbi:amidohydrolase family protein [Clostridium sp. JS66]|uniref:amidohydrolase family protein n=1 Tax=Clostridium sp. JS66 TaxID=3064705 RepID=UPI00298DD06A|nr:amidohydrolase family protein [Clostridium sp. JS66]WPC43429.1 amidohydrolase family protein [Clostridium sp. JS66]